MRLTLAQIHIEAGDVGGNVDRAADAIATAADHGADLVVLPEIFTIGYFEFDLYTRRAESLDGETLGRIRATAREYDVAILAGSIVEDLGATARADNDVPVPATDGLANTAVLFDREGRRLSVYRKHHLFGYGSEEADILVPGESLQTAELGGFDVGVTTCYDLRFPELYRRLAERGATLILVPGAWPYPRVEHWELLPRARAVENLLYVATCNGSGSFDDGELVGRSSVFDPWGTILAGSADDPTLVTAQIDPERVSTLREEFPALQDRRSDL